MSEVDDLERRVSGLTAAELAEFRRWFAAFDAEAWDRQIEADVAAGKLNRLADEALREHSANRTSDL
jgi:hypothetical protein